MDIILEVKNLKKNYGAIEAVKDLSFKVEKGTLYAFLGPNGAGKSTTINIITTLLEQNAGEVFVNGQTNKDYIRRKIGVVFQGNVLDNHLTVKENLLYRGAFYLDSKNLKNRYEELREMLGFKDFENQKFKTLSGGQKRRIEIARALFSEPEILLLDEPTTGLDPETRQVVWQIIDTLREQQNITIFLTTHYMEEAANADHVIIIDKGLIKAEGSPATLKETYSKDRIKLVPHDQTKLEDALKKNNYAYKVVADQYIITFDTTIETLDLIEKVKENIKSFEVLKGTLDDVFINVIGGEHHV